MSNDKEFENLFELIAQLLKLCKLAPSKLSELGQSHSVSALDKSYWSEKLPKEIKENEQLLKALVKNGILKNREEIDSRLEFFRTLSRYISEAGPGNCYWSAYYPEIRKLQSEIAIQLDKIDEKYKLGWEALD